MVIEQEIIEQLADEADGRSMNWLISFVSDHTSRLPLEVLGGMWKANQLELKDAGQTQLPRWQIERCFREKSFVGSERVFVTEQAVAWRYDDAT